MIWLPRLLLFAVGNLSFMCWWYSVEDPVLGFPRWLKTIFLVAGLVCWAGLVSTFL